LTADEIIKELGLEPHPEGGFFRETFRDPQEVDGRSVGTAIYFLLKAGKPSHWHKVDAAEIWHFYAGSPLELRLSDGTEKARSVTLGTNLDDGERPQQVVLANEWQSAKTLGDWTLVGCTVSPGFEFSSFVLAEDGWEPGV